MVIDRDIEPLTWDEAKLLFTGIHRLPAGLRRNSRLLRRGDISFGLKEGKLVCISAHKLTALGGSKALTFMWEWRPKRKAWWRLKVEV